MPLRARAAVGRARLLIRIALGLGLVWPLRRERILAVDRRYDLYRPPPLAGRQLDRFAAGQRRGVADRRDIFLVGFHAAALEHGGAGDKGIGAGSRQLAGDIGTDAAIDLDVDRTARDHRPEIADLAERGRDEGLPAKAGID